MNNKQTFKEWISFFVSQMPRFKHCIFFIFLLSIFGFLLFPSQLLSLYARYLLSAAVSVMYWKAMAGLTVWNIWFGVMSPASSREISTGTEFVVWLSTRMQSMFDNFPLISSSILVETTIKQKWKTIKNNIQSKLQKYTGILLQYKNNKTKQKHKGL